MRYSHNINDFSDLRDELDRSPIARQIASELFNASDPTVIGVYGSWGSGKSHLLSQSIAQIFERNVDSATKLIVCTFDAWKYELEGDLAVGLIKSLQNVERQAVGHNPVLSGVAYKEIADVLLYAISEVAENALPAGKLVSAVAKIAGRALTTFGDRERQEPDSDTDAHVDVIHAQMRKLVSAILAAARDSDPGSDYRLVVFIDDLDRCSPESMVRMFEWLKVHLLVGECTYAMALDNIAAARAIVGRYREYLGSDRDLGYGLRYLEKLFDSEYELDLAPAAESMALKKVYGPTCPYGSVSALTTSADGVGTDFPGVGGIDDLLQLRGVRTPRTMMKIVAKYCRAMSLLHAPEAEHMRHRLPASYPFWLAYVVAIYYRLEPSRLDDFVRGRGPLYELMRNPKSVPAEMWGDGPMYEFCSFTYDFASRSRQSMQVPDPSILFALAQVLRENAVRQGWAS